MLPERLSNGLCSLNPRVDRLVLSAILDLDSKGPRDGLRVRQGSHPQRPPHDVHRGRADPRSGAAPTPAQDDERRYGPYLEDFRLMGEVAALLRERREARGSIDFDLPGRGRRPGRRGLDRRDRARGAQRRAPADRGVHAGGQRGRGEEAALRQAARDLPRARSPRPGPPRRSEGGPRGLRLRAQGRPGGGAAVGLPAAAQADRGQAGGAPACTTSCCERSGRPSTPRSAAAITRSRRPTTATSPRRSADTRT